MSEDEAVLAHPAMVRILRRMAANSTDEYSIHYQTIERASKFCVRLEEAELYATVSQTAWQHGMSVTWRLWKFAQYLGREDFLEISESFELGLESTLDELHKMLEAGMSLEALAEFSHWYDDGSYNCGRLGVHDVLGLWRQKVPGSYYGAVAKHLDWADVPPVRDIITMKVEGVPADAANTMLQGGLTAEQVISCFLGGIPVEYAVELAHVG